MHRKLVMFSTVICGSLRHSLAHCVILFSLGSSTAGKEIPLNVLSPDHLASGAWQLPSSKIEFSGGEMKIDVYIRGLGDAYIQLSPIGLPPGDSAIFSVDMDMFTIGDRSTISPAWSGFELTLGTGLGAEFEKSPQNDGLHFEPMRRTEDESNYFNSFTFDNSGSEPNTLTWFDGQLPSVRGKNLVSSLTFSVVASDQLDGSIDGETAFVLRIQGTPLIVPEPLSWPVCSIAFPILVIRQRTRRRMRSSGDERP